MADYEVRGKLGLDSSSFIASAAAASEALNKVDLAARRATSGLGMLGTEADVAAGQLAKADMASVGLASTMTSKFSPALLSAKLALGDLVYQGVKFVSQYQQAGIAFTSMLGSADASTKMLKELGQFAAKTPFTMPGLITASKQLMAFGFSAKDVLPDLTAIGDAASGLGMGADGIQRITYALGQMNQKANVQQQDLRQLQEAGVPALSYLADAYHVNTAKIQDMISKGLIPAKDGVQILISGMEYGTATGMKFGGMMDKQSKSLAGLASTMADTLRLSFNDASKNYVPALSDAAAKFIPKIGTIMNDLMKVVTTVIGGIASFAGMILKVLKPAIDIAVMIGGVFVAGILLMINVIKDVSNWISKHAQLFQILASIVGVVVMAYAAYRAEIVIQTALQKAWLFITGLQTAATDGLALSQRMLNAAIAMNPIGMMVAAAVAMVAAFILLWNHSKAFREIVIEVGKMGVEAFGFIIEVIGKLATAAMKVSTGPLTLLLKGLALLHVPGAKEALGAISTVIDDVGNFFDSAAKKVDSFTKTLDGLANKKISLPSFSSKGGSNAYDPKYQLPLPTQVTSGDLGAGKGTGAAGATGIIADLQSVLAAYNDYIQGDFKNGFTQGADKAKTTIVDAIGQMKKVFDEQGKILGPSADKMLNDAFNTAETNLRGFIPQAQAIAQQLDDVNTALDKANKDLEQAISDRASSAKKLGEILATPFGTPSQLATAMSSASATADSVVSMYQNIVAELDKRYAGLDPNAKSKMVSYLENETQQLVNLIKDRAKIVEDLKTAQTGLDKVLADAQSFQDNTTKSLTGFAQSLLLIGSKTTDTTIRAIKTAQGWIVTQMQSGTVQSVIDQLTTRYQAVKDFTDNINKLLAAGLNKTYIQQLLAAGPEAAGATAALLTTAGDEQIKAINNLYTNIDALAGSFCADMKTTMYGDAINAAQAVVDGLNNKLNAIQKQMDDIVTSINDTLKPLGDVGYKAGTDLMQQMVDALKAKQAELIAQAQAIATAVAAAMAAALSGIGVSGAQLPNFTPPPVTQLPSGGGGSSSTGSGSGSSDSSGSNDTSGSSSGSPAVTSAVKAMTAVTIKAGDTLSGIAKAAGESLTQLLKDNPVFTTNSKYNGGNTIFSGGTVKVPTAAPAPVPETSFMGSGSGVNTSSLAGIAKASGVTIAGDVTINNNSQAPIDSPATQATVVGIFNKLLDAKAL